MNKELMFSSETDQWATPQDLVKFANEILNAYPELASVPSKEA
jgi:hypothetical protein